MNKNSKRNAKDPGNTNFLHDVKKRRIPRHLTVRWNIPIENFLNIVTYR
jgi:hypothetical protein